MNHETITTLLDQAEANFRLESSEILRMANTSPADVDEVEGFEHAGQHPADVASETAEREIALSLVAEVSEVLAEIAAARRRLADGVYGRCEGCGKQIDPTRLRAVPWARRCIADENSYQATGSTSFLERRTAPLWSDETADDDDSRQGSTWDPEDDHPFDAVEEAALHEIRTAERRASAE